MSSDPHRYDLLPKSALDIVGLLARGEVSPLELVDLCGRRIEQTDQVLNALPTRCLDRAREGAKRIQDGEIRTDGDGAWLAGLPIAVKDLNDVAGVRTTYGSTIFADHVPERSDFTVERLESRGAVVLAKSNTPEFGAGGTTFNDVFGTTANPWDTTKTCGGSSGGSAAAVASGQVWAATGSDLGGSLRIPASFCGVVGLRPTPGVVPRGPASQPFSPLWVDGPIARSVPDCALLLDAMAGRDPRDPLSRERPGSFVSATRAQSTQPFRLAVSRDLGISPIDDEIAQIFANVADLLAGTGAAVVEAHPDLSGATEIFRILRAAWLAGDLAELLDTHENQMKPELVSNIRKGMELTAEEIGRAEAARAVLYRHVVAFFEGHDFLITPAAVVPPFDVGVRYPEEIGGTRLETYFDWYAITYTISVTACPAISIPVGLTDAGLPVGIQIVAPPFHDAALLNLAARLEESFEFEKRLPIDPVVRVR